MKNYVFLIALFTVLYSRAQEQGELNFSFGYGSQAWQMDQINSIILDPQQIHIGQLNVPRINTFHNARKLTGSFGCQLTALWGINAYADYQFANVVHNDGYEVTIDGQPDTLLNETVYTNSTLVLGVGTRFSLGNFLKLHEKANFMNRLQFGVNASVGYGLTTFQRGENIYNIDDVNIGNEFIRYVGHSRGIQSKISFDLGLLMTKSTIISKIGCEFGYQYLNSGIFETRAGTDFMETNSQVRANMSGVFVTGIFTIGK